MDTEKDHIALMFNDIAPTYDKLNHILSLNIDKIWRRKAVRCIGKSVSKCNMPKILDVACGTADSTVQIAKTIKNAVVHAIDISEGMLAIGQEKVKKMKLDDKISFYQSSAEHIVSQNDTYDAVIVAFGVRNFSDRVAGLEEIFRVMKPDGTLVVLELSVPRNKVLRGIYNLYFKNILPLIGKSVSGNAEAYRYLHDSVTAFPMPNKFIKTLKSCGFTEIRHQPLTFGLCRIYQAKK